MEEKKQKLNQWNEVKYKLHVSRRDYPAIDEGSVWWCALGENIGVEMNGKSSLHSRPVLVYKKLNRHCFLAIPLTSQEKSGSWYVEFRFGGKKEWAALSQVRVVSVSRLYNRIGYVDDQDMEKVKTGFRALYC